MQCLQRVDIPVSLEPKKDVQKLYRLAEWRGESWRTAEEARVAGDVALEGDKHSRCVDDAVAVG